MQDTQQTPEILKHHMYLMYEVTVPHDYWNQECEDKVKWAPPGTFTTLADLMLGVKHDGCYKEPIYLIGVNNQFSIHPGNSRYVLNRVDHSMPPLKGIVVDRYNTSKQSIESVFGPCKLHEDNIISYWNFKNQPDKYNIGHTVKYGRNENKNGFDREWIDTGLAEFGVDITLRCMYNKKPVVEYGRGANIIEKDISCMSDFGKYVLEYFYET